MKKILLLVMLTLPCNAFAEDKSKAVPEDPVLKSLGVELDEKSISIMKNHIQVLIQHAIPYVEEQLLDDGYVEPFALSLAQNGATQKYNAKRDGVQAPVGDSIVSLRETMKLLALASPATMATGIFAPAIIPDQSRGVNVQGISMEMEHRLGIAVLRFVPVKIDKDKGEVEYISHIEKSLDPYVFKLATTNQQSEPKD